VIIWHILPRDEWERARTQSEYAPSSLRTEGFIHFSYEHQLLGSAARHFAGHRDLVAISVQRQGLGERLVEENGFPHLYAPLELTQVGSVVELLASDGEFRLGAKTLFNGE
jgi:uncharacterized protein (DUF952 family)